MVQDSLNDYYNLFDVGNVAVIEIKGKNNTIFKKKDNSFSSAIYTIMKNAIMHENIPRSYYSIKLISRSKFINPSKKETKDPFLIRHIYNLLNSIDGEHTVNITVYKNIPMVSSIVSHFFNPSNSDLLTKDITMVWNYELIESLSNYINSGHFKNVPYLGSVSLGGDDLSSGKLKNVRIDFPDIDHLLSSNNYDCFDGLPFYCTISTNFGYHDTMQIEHWNVIVTREWKDEDNNLESYFERD